MTTTMPLINNQTSILPTKKAGDRGATFGGVWQNFCRPTFAIMNLKRIISWQIVVAFVGLAFLPTPIVYAGRFLEQTAEVKSQRYCDSCAHVGLSVFLQLVGRSSVPVDEAFMGVAYNLAVGPDPAPT